MTTQYANSIVQFCLTCWVRLGEFPTCGGTAAYSVGFPRSGEWKVLINTDSDEYSPYATHVELNSVEANSRLPMDGQPYGATFDIAPYSALIFSQVSN